MIRVNAIIFILIISVIFTGCDNTEDEHATEAISHINYENLSQENLERGAKTAYNNAGFWEKFKVNWSDPFLTLVTGKSKYVRYGENHPAEVRQAQLNDYYTFDASNEERDEVESTATRNSVRDMITGNLLWILLFFIAIILLVIVLKCTSTRGNRRHRGYQGYRNRSYHAINAPQSRPSNVNIPVLPMENMEV